MSQQVDQHRQPMDSQQAMRVVLVDRQNKLQLAPAKAEVDLSAPMLMNMLADLESWANKENTLTPAAAIVCG